MKQTSIATPSSKHKQYNLVRRITLGVEQGSYSVNLGHILLPRNKLLN